MSTTDQDYRGGVLTSKPMTAQQVIDETPILVLLRSPGRVFYSCSIDDGALFDRAADEIERLERDLADALDRLESIALNARPQEASEAAELRRALVRIAGWREIDRNSLRERLEAIETIALEAIGMAPALTDVDRCAHAVPIDPANPCKGGLFHDFGTRPPPEAAGGRYTEYRCAIHYFQGRNPCPDCAPVEPGAVLCVPCLHCSRHVPVDWPACGHCGEVKRPLTKEGP